MLVNPSVTPLDPICLKLGKLSSLFYSIETTIYSGLKKRINFILTSLNQHNVQPFCRRFKDDFPHTSCDPRSSDKYV